MRGQSEQVANHIYIPRRAHRQPEDDDIYDEPSRLPTSALRYDRTPVVVNGNRRYVFHNTPPPVVEQVAPGQRRRVHWSLIFGVGMIAMFTLWILGNMLINWWGVMQDDIHYGRPRTFQIDKRVGHNDSTTPSHFIAMNLNRKIEIIEFPGGDITHAKIYFAMTLLGNGEDLAVATLSFKDVNGDGKPDMIVTVGDTHYVLINDNGQFRPLKPGEQIAP